MISSTSNTKITPPLKWAGGKRWLTHSHSHLLPKSFNKYIEPFAGSAAVFFHLAPNSAVIADINSELIDTYEALKQCWKKVFELLVQHEKKHSDEHYYFVRKSKPRSAAARAARFIYLNRTCFNGIYRVNKSGTFNVPKGSKDSVILETDDFELVSSLLKKTALLTSDFEPVIELAREGDLLFVDPPYTVMHGTNGFIKYNEVLFSWKDQLRLADCLRRASLRNVIVLATNANHASVRKIYKDSFRLSPLERKSLISGNSSHRKTVKELLIRSF
jgi:DNA adenine methylase